MIVLSVQSYNGVPSSGGASAGFDELGGTIGRADSNQLVLPDPERTISRVHARVLFRASGYFIVDNGSNPISVNGAPVGAGRECALQPGDTVQIGGYVLAVTESAAAGAGDPFAELFGDAASGLAGPAPAASPAGARPPAAAAAPGAAGASAASAAAALPRSTRGLDPALAADWPAPPPPRTAAWPSPPAPAPRAAPPAAAASGLAPAGTPALPEDWDPFAPDHPAPDAPAGAALPTAPMSLDWAPAAPAPAGWPAAAPAPVNLDWSPAGPGAPGLLPPGGGDSLDDLFGLAGAPASADPLGAAPAQLLGRPNTAGAADPLRALAGEPVAPAASRPDHGSELHTPMPLPPAARPAAGPAAQPRGAVFSWDDPPREGRMVTLPGGVPDDGPLIAPGGPAQAPPRAAPTLAPDLSSSLAIDAADVPALAPLSIPGSTTVAASTNRLVGTPPRTRAPAGGVPTEPAGPVTGASAADVEALRRAFVEGLASPGLRLSTLTPETMKLVGELLREATRGTVELLVARAALKRELRAEMTMIVARENNPLKFSPTVDVALQHLMGERTPGFMAPAPALRDAYDDLRAHQLGVMAGMRAALEGVLARFDPAQLEGKLTNKSSITNLIPAARKARLWELFQELFAQLQAEAEDDFEELFGRAFLRAYEEQMARLAGEPR